jgi:hypothetical protein
MLFEKHFTKSENIFCKLKDNNKANSFKKSGNQTINEDLQTYKFSLEKLKF